MSGPVVLQGEATAAVLVEVFPLRKGWVQLQVRSVGPVALTAQEEIRVLRQAADSMEQELAAQEEEQR